MNTFIEETIKEFDIKMPIDMEVPNYLKTDEQKYYWVREEVKSFLRQALEQCWEKAQNTQNLVCAVCGERITSRFKRTKEDGTVTHLGC